MTALAELAVGDFDSEAPRAYSRSFAAKAERQEGDTAGEAAWGGRRTGSQGKQTNWQQTEPCRFTNKLVQSHTSFKAPVQR